MTKNKNSKKVQSLIQLGLFVGIVVFLNILANARFGGKGLYAYLDMTEEKRFTLTDGTKNLLSDLDEVVYVNVLLEGEFPAGFKRLQTAARDMLEDFRSESGYIEYGFQDPNEGSVEQRNQLRESLSKDNVNPINLRVKTKEGTAERLIYPYAIFYYKGRNIAVNLLENEMPGVPPEVILNNSIGLLEYKFANAIQKLQSPKKPVIVFSSGHGELEPVETADLEKSLRQFYDTGRINLDSVTTLKQDASVFVIAKPTQPFSEKDKFKLDQYVMNGGKVLWLMDQVRVDLDSLQMRKEYYPTEYDLNLDDLLFRYGARVNPTLVLDMQCTRIPLATGVVGNAPQFDYFRYPYHVVATPRSNHPIVKSIGPVNLLYPNNLDTVQTKMPVDKTILLTSSPNSRYQRIPIGMDFEFLRYDLDASKFDKGPQNLAVLLEGTFSSFYENRVEPSMLNTLEQIGAPFQTQSPFTRMIVVADGDMAKNRYNPRTQAVSPLGYNEFEKYQFANKEFLINAIEYLVDENGVIEARGKEVKLRLLDTVKAQDEEVKWQLINIVLPIAFLILFGLAYNFLRRRRFARQGRYFNKNKYTNKVMKRTLILLIIFLLLGGAAAWYMTSQGDSKTSVAGADREFAIKDESIVHKVFVADRYGHKSTLEREGDHWIYNGKYRARENAIENMMDAVTRIEMKYKPPQAAVEKMVESLATEGLKVELYDKENQMLKSYYIGGSTPDERGTYVMLSDAEQPYVAYLPGWEGNLRFRFSLNDDEWRDRTLFALEVEDIQAVSIEYPKQRNKSFRLEKDGSEYKLTPFYDITPVINKPLQPATVEAYLSNFKKIVATGFHNEYENRDEVTSVLPFATITVQTTADKKYEYSLFPILTEEQKDPKTGGVLANANISNFYVETQDGDLVAIQSRIINKIMWGYEFFYKQPLYQYLLPRTGEYSL